MFHYAYSMYIFEHDYFFINELNVLHYFKMIVFVYFTFNKAILVDCFIH